MRYKEGEPIPEELLASHASDDMLFLTAIIGVIVGIILFYLGRHGKQMYLWVWGLGLVVVSILMGGSIKFGWSLF